MEWIQITCFVCLPWILHTWNYLAMYECRGKGMYYCITDEKCINMDWVCDGVHHCMNGEDEKPPICTMDNCLRKGWVFCDTICMCLHKNWVCDGINDCVNGEDESTHACTLKRNCESNWTLSVGCLNRCKPGYFGNYCEKLCSETCLNKICNIQSGICTNCSPGYYDKYCVKSCSKECLNGICNNSSGICNDCTTGYYGKYCDKTCPEECLNETCNTSSGICTKCELGYFGRYCEKSCSNECLNGICDSSSGICKDCTRTYLESCSLRCGHGCLQRNGFPQCDRQSGKCLHGCYLTYGSYCNETCSNCKRTSSVAPCDIDGVCLLGCESEYWDKKCSSKCSANCQGDEHKNRCNSSTGECLNGCAFGWNGRFCEVASDVSSFLTTESTDKESVNSLKTTLIVISAIFTVVVVVVGSACFLLARKRFIRQRNNRMEPGSVFPDGVQPTQQISGSRRRHSSNVYADINEETMEYYHYICEQNSPDNCDEIKVTNDPDFEIVPLKEFTDQSDSRRSVTKSESKDDLDSTEETGRGVTQFNVDLDHVCKLDSTRGVIPKRSDIQSNISIEHVGTNDVLDLEAHSQTTKAENRQIQAAKYCNEGEDIFGDLGQFQVEYIHAIASEECELFDNELDHQTVQSSL